MELYGFLGVWGGGVVRIVLGVYWGDSIGMGRRSGTPGGFCCPRGVEEGELSAQELTILKISDMKPWELLF